MNELDEAKRKELEKDLHTSKEQLLGWVFLERVSREKHERVNDLLHRKHFSKKMNEDKLKRNLRRMNAAKDAMNVAQEKMSIFVLHIKKIEELLAT